MNYLYAGSNHTCEKYCVFELSSRAYAVLATSVREVGISPNVTVVPGASRVLAGLAHIRNDFIPILDFESTAQQTAARKKESQLVVMAGDQGAWAILVDRVIGLAPLEVSLRSDEGGPRGLGAAAMGTATMENQVVQVLDERALYRRVATLINEAVTTA